MSSEPRPVATNGGMRAWGHFAIGVGLLVGAAACDVTKPFGKSWSIFYLLPVLYVASTLRGRLELVLHGAFFVTVFLAPMLFRPSALWSGTGFYNRGMGVVLAVVVIGLMWNRRRYIDALNEANRELENRVGARTAELQAANERLHVEIVERKRVEADQKQLENQLLQARKMEAVGYLAGGIAHDFNNLLTVIKGDCTLLLDQVPPQSPLRASLLEVQKSGERGAELTQQLLAFSRKQILQPRIININEGTASAESLIRRLLPENIRVVIDLSPTVRPVMVDPGQLTQVLLNLASNARDAMPQGGELRITTEQVKLSREQVSTSPGLNPGAYVRLSVSDTGQGMDELARLHVFEPFFTTKEVGKGTGLGLASVYGIIRQSGGHIDLISEVGRGTTFNIFLPCVSGADEPLNASPQSPDDLPRGCETILLVEDEDRVRALAAVFLRNAGYRVFEARNGKEALTIATSKDAPPFALVISDVVMPEMGGPELARCLASLRPDLRVLLLTGYPRTECADGIGQPEFLLEKPFSRQEFLVKIRAILDLRSEEAALE